MSKLFFEMTETESTVTEYFKQSGICAVPDVNRDQRMRQRHYDKRRASRNRAERAEFVRGSYERYTEADRRVCITGRRWTVARNGSGRNHADQCRKRGSVRSNPETFRLGMEKAKSENVVEHPVYGSEDMEELRQCVLIDLEDCMTKDRETGEKGEALCMTFQNEEGKYIIIKHTITNLFFIFKA